MTQSRHLSAIGMSLITLQPSLSAHAQTYPSVVQAQIREAMDSCKPEKIKLPKDFVTRRMSTETAFQILQSIGQPFCATERARTADVGMYGHRICVAAKWDLHESIGQPCALLYVPQN